MATATFDVVYGTRTIGVPVPYLSIHRRPRVDDQPTLPVRPASDRLDRRGLLRRQARATSARALQRALDTREADTDRALTIRAGSGF